MPQVKTSSSNMQSMHQQASRGSVTLRKAEKPHSGHLFAPPHCWWQDVLQPASRGHATCKKQSNTAAASSHQRWFKVCITVPKQAEQCSTPLPFPRALGKAVHQQEKQASSCERTWLPSPDLGDGRASLTTAPFALTPLLAARASLIFTMMFCHFTSPLPSCLVMICIEKSAPCVWEQQHQGRVSRQITADVQVLDFELCRLNPRGTIRP